MQLALSLAALAAVVIAVAALCRRYDLPAPIILVALALDSAGITDLGWGDPMRWVAEPHD